MWEYALSDMGLSSPVVTKIMMLTLVSLTEKPELFKSFFDQIGSLF